MQRFSVLASRQAAGVLRQLHTQPAARGMFAYPSVKKSTAVSDVDRAAKTEKQRQLDELILIPSESICFPEVAKIMESEFANIYAEGQPMLRLSRASGFLAEDEAMFRAWHARLSDGRFYRGCLDSDRVELLAKLNIAKAFSLLKGSPSADSIYVSVQALSGSPANLAIYNALLKPGDKMLTLDLTHGGHLSHGSPYNVSGKNYKVQHYGVDVSLPPSQRRLDYDRIRKQALEFKPQIIVGGSSAYPWDWDWAALRSIADEVGAYLLADVCHMAGMIVGGQLNNPLPHADVVMFTTHKTLMGPRGAAIVAKCPEISRKIDNAIFPGLQGGPHINSIAGIARLFEVILQDRDTFCQLQRKVIENSSVFANALKEQGFEIEYGGTNTHVMLLDLKSFKVKGGGVLDGETASRIMENVGIVCNKNTLPGDISAADSSGLRFGTPWLTQRGINEPQLKTLASIIKDLLSSSTAFKVWTPSGEEKARGRVPYTSLVSARDRVTELAQALPYPKRDGTSVTSKASSSSSSSAGGRTGLLFRGEKARLSLNQAVTCDVLALKEGQTAVGYLLDDQGKEIDSVVVQYLGWQPNAALGPNGEERFAVYPSAGKAQSARKWLSALSDAHLLLEKNDPNMKVDGPFVVEPLPASAALTAPAAVTALTTALTQSQTLPASLAGAVKQGLASVIDTTKPFFVGQSSLAGSASSSGPAPFVYAPPAGGLKKTVLHPWHAKAGAKLVPFGGWEMPVEYPAGIFGEHAAVRTAAGLFDVSHMSAIDVQGPNALPFLETVVANAASRLVDNEAQYSYMLRETGEALDDLYVYRLAREKYMVVVNAGNFERDWAWLTAVNEGRVLIDPKNPGKRVPRAEIKPLRDSGADAVLDLAFQGPLSMKVLQELAKSDEERASLAGGKLNNIHQIHVGGIEVTACRTGYTGEEVGYELFVHPDRAQDLWEMLLEHGKSRGVLAIGLGARDSLRTEAGLPLFGHELEGPEALSLTEADYGFVSRMHRPFYVGRQQYIDRLTPRGKRVLRLHGQGRKSVRPGHGILDSNGNRVGSVTSFAFTDKNFNFTALAAVSASFNPAVGTGIKAYRSEKPTEAPTDVKKMVDVSVVTRFPTLEEKRGWKNAYKQQ